MSQVPGGRSVPCRTCSGCHTRFATRHLLRIHLNRNVGPGGCQYIPTQGALRDDEAGHGSGGGNGSAIAETDNRRRTDDRYSSGRINAAARADSRAQGNGLLQAAEGISNPLLRHDPEIDTREDDGGEPDSDDEYNDEWAFGVGLTGTANPGEGGEPEHQEVEGASDDAGADSASCGPCQYSNPPTLESIHRQMGGDVMEGGDGNVKWNESARNGDYYPFKSLTQALLFVFINKHQLSRAAVKDLFALLQVTDGEEGDGLGEGQRFEVSDVPENPDNFISRARQYLPLLEVIKRTVPTKVGGRTASVFDIPLNLQYARFLKSKRAMKEMQANPGGRVLRGLEAATNGLSSDHVFSGPVQRVGGQRRTFMDGELSRTSPFYGFDGVLCREGGRRVYIGEIVVAELNEGDGTPPARRPCRILAIFWDAESKQICVTVRVFRFSEEVLGVEPQVPQNRAGVRRTWEEQGASAECRILPSALIDLCEMLSVTDLDEGKHREPWPMGSRHSSEWTLVCEGFVTRRRAGSSISVGHKRGRSSSGGGGPSGGRCDWRRAGRTGQRDEGGVSHEGGGSHGTPFVVSGSWRREGGVGESFPDMRQASTFHNTSNLPFCGIGTILSIDAFNVWSIQNSLSEGGTYATMACLTPALQRLQHHLHVTTVAESGAIVEGEMAMSCGVLGEMEKGCLTQAWVATSSGEQVLLEVFFRGGALLVIADSPQRALILGCKHPNSTSLHPCPYCNVTQSGEDEDDLGDPGFDIARHRRTRDQYISAFNQLSEVPLGPQRTSLSVQLGVVPKREDLPSPMYDLVSAGEVHRRIPPEMLHVDALNHLGVVQPWFLNLLNRRGRQVVSSMTRQRDGGLYHPGAILLKDPVKKYSSYTGSHKWEFGSIMLIVFRPILQNVESMKSCLKAYRLKELCDDGDFNLSEVMERLRLLLQCSSALSFAIRSPVWGEAEIAGLTKRVKDWMLVSKDVMGARQAVRPSIHSMLHLPQAIRDAGRMPDASVGEHGHQLHKRSNVSGSGRDPAAHHIRRVNTALAVDALADGTSWRATGRDRANGGHRVYHVESGAGCVRVFSELRATLPGGLACPLNLEKKELPSTGSTLGQYAGAASWRVFLWEAEGGNNSNWPENWRDELGLTYMRPDEKTMLAGYKTWYACGRRAGDPMCRGRACPNCWCSEEGGRRLDIQYLDCTRFSTAAPRAASSGTRRWKGGNVKAAAATVAHRHAWAFGADSGENTEIFTSPQSAGQGDVGVGKLTLGKMLYFFTHEGNTRPGENGPRPKTEWVAAYEYVSSAPGRGNAICRDSATKHPVFHLRGQAGRPSVFPVEAIRRHVSMAHACPANGCGPGDTSLQGEPPVWKHHFKLADSDGRSVDSYMLNEHQHSILRPDSFT